MKKIININFSFCQNHREGIDSCPRTPMGALLTVGIVVLANGMYFCWVTGKRYYWNI